MNILIACEYSGIVREAFKKKGHNVWSCDLLDTEIPGQHYKGDVLKILNKGWDMMIAHPPCTELTVSGARWFKDKSPDLQIRALEFVKTLLNAPIKRIALENPVGVISTHIRKPDQIIQPWQFGHAEFKRTCLWLKNLPKLKYTKIITENRKETLFQLGPSKDRWKERSRTFTGIAEAMAEQWS